VCVALLAAGCSSGSHPASITVGAIYPLSGSQGPGGTEEYRGVRLAVDMVNAAGGVGGRSIRLSAIDVPGSDAVPGAVDRLAGHGVRFLLGSYGSTISAPAAALAARKGMLFWETGAVGEMPSSGASGGMQSFRVAPTGATLGRSAIEFVAHRLTPLLHRRAGALRFVVAEVGDAYGREVGGGAVREIRRLGLRFGGRVDYDPHHLDAAAVVRRIAALRPDVLFVSAYLDDGVALRRETVRQHLPLVASIGTSSSYCMPMFGQALGRRAVGLFASDKPDADSIGTQGLAQPARALLAKADADYRHRYGEEMSAPALAGFAAAWALFRWVMPRAGELSPDGVAAEARQMRLPLGMLPNGSGLRFAPPGSPDAGSNLRAATVIWEWTAVDRRAVVWPPRFATEQARAIPLAE
jgi:branched-chain amino acid transport system substrate-binding protein